MSEDRRHQEAVERDAQDRERFAIRREEEKEKEREEGLEAKLEKLTEDEAAARTLADQEIEREQGKAHQHPPPDAPP